MLEVVLARVAVTTASNTIKPTGKAFTVEFKTSTIATVAAPKIFRWSL